MRLIERVWFNNDKAKWWLVPLLLPFTCLFWLITTLRRFLYRIGIFKAVQADVPVIVIGNIGIGGNGKTPLTIFLIDLCKSLNINVGVVSRGYGGKAPYYPFLLDENSTSQQAGDEPLMMFQRCQVPIAVGPERVKNIALLQEQGCQLILADDGLQHYQMAREKELIVVDGKRQFGNGLLLPAGPLREGVARLQSADLVVVNGEVNLNLGDQVNMTLKPQVFININSGEQIAVDSFAEQFSQVNAIAAIGDPARFFNTLKQCNITPVSEKGFVDHHLFSLQDLQSFDNSLPLVMTEKDAVKCQGFSQDHWWYLAVSADFNEQTNTLFKHMIDQCLTHSQQ